LYRKTINRCYKETKMKKLLTVLIVAAFSMSAYAAVKKPAPA
jgi:hypothetical protein